MRYHLLVLTTLTCVLALLCGPGSAGDKKEKTPMKNLIAELQSEDGQKRVAATRELLEQGKGALDELKKAGAKSVTPSGTIDSRRLDVVYSLIEGLSPGNYTRNGFGLRVENGTTQEEVAKMGKRHGFTLNGTFRPDTVPNVYVQLDQGKTLADVLRQVLTSEMKVVSVNLNYVVR